MGDEGEDRGAGLHTARLFADPLNPAACATAVSEAAAILRRGGTVAFATETVYGLGANALDPGAVAKIFAAKRRPAWDPLIVHVADAAGLAQVAAELPEPARLWMERFCPGPLTLLLPKSPGIPDAVTAGRPRVGVRMPAHPVAQALLRAAGIPIAAPSANLFGHVSPTTAEHVLADLDGRIDAVLDAGPAQHGLESTVVDCCEDPCVLYRPGAVTLEQLRSVWARVEVYREAAASSAAAPESLPSPGVGLRHYAPSARVVLIEHGPRQARELLAAIEALPGPGVMLPEGLLSQAERATIAETTPVFAWGGWHRPEEMAERLFAGMRQLDALKCSRIICPLPEPSGIGMALCDRLRKAAR